MRVGEPRTGARERRAAIPGRGLAGIISGFAAMSAATSARAITGEENNT
jgi:hypothetical protein